MKDERQVLTEDVLLFNKVEIKGIRYFLLNDEKFYLLLDIKNFLEYSKTSSVSVIRRNLEKKYGKEIVSKITAVQPNTKRTLGINRKGLEKLVLNSRSSKYKENIDIF